MKVDQFKILEKLGWKFVSYSKGRITSYEFYDNNLGITMTVDIHEDDSIYVTFSYRDYIDIKLIKELASIDCEVL